MSRDLLLARRLIEAAADPEADRESVEAAAFELAQVLGRIGVEPGRGLPVSTFEDMTAEDLSPHAWLLLLESRRPGEAQVPAAILDAVFLANADPVIRFRLVSGALHRDGPEKPFDWLFTEGEGVVGLEALPPSWPRDRLIGMGGAEPDEDRSGDLAEMALYLLQDGSPLALALAAAAIAPAQSWRGTAREIVGSLVRHADPNLSDIGRYFRGVGI